MPLPSVAAPFWCTGGAAQPLTCFAFKKCTARLIWPETVRTTCFMAQHGDMLNGWVCIKARVCRQRMHAELGTHPHAARLSVHTWLQGGKEPNSNDCKLGPQLKHVIIGSKEIKVP